MERQNWVRTAVEKRAKNLARFCNDDFTNWIQAEQQVLKHWKNVYRSKPNGGFKPKAMGVVDVIE